MLKGLWKDGFTASQIASKLGGCSRSAVCAKAHRIGLYRKFSPEHREPPKPRPRRTRDRLVLINGATGEQTDIRSLANEPKPLTQADGSPIGVLEIEKGQCRWPFGNSKDLSTFHFCAHPVRKDSSFCEHHHSRAFDKIRTRQSEDRAKERDFERRCAA
ncbi:MAG TPA: GcrA family cell cycle regulator, partial [Terriglobales bacterium]|nr:GcrA family cell cycle regulator [Terriglobales bacterium]